MAEESPQDGRVTTQSELPENRVPKFTERIAKKATEQKSWLAPLGDWSDSWTKILGLPAAFLGLLAAFALAVQYFLPLAVEPPDVNAEIRATEDLEKAGFQITTDGRSVEANLVNANFNSEQVTEVKDCLGKLSSLEVARIASCGLKDLRLVEKASSLRRIVASENKLLSSLWDASTQPNLQVVELIGNPSLHNVAGISGHEKLSLLDLSRSGVKNLKGVSSLPVLTTLVLDRCPKFNPSKLAASDRLMTVESVSLLGCEAMIDLSWLTQFPNLKHLDLTACAGVVDVSPLITLSHLETLGLSETSVPLNDDKNQSAFTSLKAIKSLSRVFWTEASAVDTSTQGFTFSLLNSAYSER